MADVSKAAAVSHSLSVEKGYGLDSNEKRKVSKTPMRILNMAADPAHQESGRSARFCRKTGFSVVSSQIRNAGSFGECLLKIN
jgi:hypothetical protein